MIQALLLLEVLAFGPCDELAAEESFSTAVASAVQCMLAANNYVSDPGLPVYLNVPSFEQNLIRLGLLPEAAVVVHGSLRPDSVRTCAAPLCTSEADGIRITLLEAERSGAGAVVLVEFEVARRPGRYRQVPTVCAGTMAISLTPEPNGWRVETPEMRRIC